MNIEAEKRLFVHYLIDAWMQHYSLAWVLHRLLEEDGKSSLARESHDLPAVKDLIERVYGKVQWVDQRVRSWLPRSMPSLNEALWAGRPRDKLQYIGERALGVRRQKTMPVEVKARASDKRHDWHTVK